MARPLRIEYPGAIYHVLSRGDRRQAIVNDDTDRNLFVERTCKRTGWEIHAYCLMSNHFHLVAETPRQNLREGQKGSELSIDTIHNPAWSNVSNRLYHVPPTGSKTITIGTATAYANMRYTLNGTTPTASNGTLINASSGTVQVMPTAEGTTLQAIAFKAGWGGADGVVSKHLTFER